MPRDVPTQLLIRCFGDRFTETELIEWSERFREERALKPLALWATVVQEVTYGFVPGRVNTIQDLEREAIREGLTRIRHDADALKMRQKTEEERIEREKRSAQLKSFQAAEMGQKAKPATRKAAKTEEAKDGGLFADVTDI